MFGLDLAPKLTKKSIPEVILVMSPLLFSITATPIFIDIFENNNGNDHSWVAVSCQPKKHWFMIFCNNSATE